MQINVCVVSEVEQVVGVDDKRRHGQKSQVGIDIEVRPNVAGECGVVALGDQTGERDDPLRFVRCGVPGWDVHLLVAFPIVSEVGELAQAFGFHEETVVRSEVITEERFVDGFDDGIQAEQFAVVFAIHGEADFGERGREAGTPADR